MSRACTPESRIRSCAGSSAAALRPSASRCRRDSKARGPVCLYVSLSLSLSLCLSLSVSLSVCLSVSLCLRLSFSLSFSLSL